MDQILAEVRWILQKLLNAGYPGYLVGGGVRDALMGRPVHDYDITTAATPDQIKAVFSEYRMLDTGLKHGTVTLLSDVGMVEITTFRLEAGYSDFRRPDRVEFTENLFDDLARRDFKMNAIALGLEGLHDPYGGQQDIQNKIICCVGDAETRFREDALRILRGLRFAATLGFQIEERTAKAIHKCAPLLAHISAERIRDEFIPLLCGDFAGDILLDYSDIVGEIIPELAPSIGFQQHTHYHSFDVYTHTVRTVEGVPPTPILRLAALLHDVAKPQTFRLDQDGVGHFYRHAAIGAPVAEEILRRLRLSNSDIQKITPLVKYHGLTRDTPIPKLPKLIAKLGQEAFFHLLALDKADSGAKHPPTQCPDDGDQIWQEIELAARDFLATTPPLTVRDLAVGGDDAMNLGLSGREIGLALSHLLGQVLENKLANHREDLLTALEIFSKNQNRR